MWKKIIFFGPWIIQFILPLQTMFTTTPHCKTNTPIGTDVRYLTNVGAGSENDNFIVN